MKRWQFLTLIVLLVAAAWAALSGSSNTVLVPPTESADPTPTPTPNSDPAVPVTLLFAGDVMLSRSVGDLMTSKNDWLWPFRQIASATAGADLAFANLETTISTRGIKGGCGYCFRADPRAVQGLVYAGFDVMSVANNHIWDYGLQAFTDTLGALATADISPVGGGRDVNEARMGVTRDVRGTRIVYLAYTDILPASAGATNTRAGANVYDESRMKEDIGAARTGADIVVVSFHTGTEYETVHNSTQDHIYKTAVDAGADLVIGSHPHVVQEIEKYGRGWIAYSLGNLVFDQTFSEPTTHGLMLSVVVKDGHIVGIEHLPISISRQYQPFLTAGQ